MPNIFKDGGGAGVGSYVVVFKNGAMSLDTDLRKLKGAYESGEQIYFSIIDDETKDALVPASGWMGEDGKLNLVARDFDDNKTYSVALDGDQSAEVDIKDGIEVGGEPLGGSVEITGNSLVIPEQPGPEPVIIIDGVAYYHKQEFDLEEIAALEFSSPNFDLITAEATTFSRGISVIKGGRQAGPVVVLNTWYGSGSIQSKVIYGLDDPVAYQSRAFNLVDSVDEVSVYGDLYLPACSAYYGFLSEDGKTFISYYNLKNEGSAYVNSIKQGNDVIPLHGKDTRLPDATTADVGKILAVNDQGELVLQ